MKSDPRKRVAAQLQSAASEIGATIDLDELMRMLFQVRVDRTGNSPGPGGNDSISVVFFALLRRQSLPDLATVRFACRLVRQNQEVCYCEPVLQAIVHSHDLAQDLHALQRAIRADRALRNELRIESTVYKKAIQQYLASVCHPSTVPRVDFSNPDAGSFAAKTNGKRIFLPYQVNVASRLVEGQLINESVLFYLAFHEVQHWGIFGARSSFEFSFDTPLGQLLLKEINPSRDQMERYRHQAARARIFRKILDEEGQSDSQAEVPPLTHLEAAAYCSPSPRLFHWFYNCFEDVRIHRQAEEVGMAELQLITKRLSLRYQRHSAFLSHFGKFFSHLVVAVMNQDASHIPLPATLKDELTEIKQWIQEMHSQPSEQLSPESSARQAWRSVQRIASSSCNDGQLEAEIEQLPPQDELTERMLRWLITRKDTIHLEGGGERLFVPPRRETVVRGLKFDEFDLEAESVLPDVVSVQTGNFRPTRKAHTSYSLAGFRWASGSRPRGPSRSSHDDMILDHHGDEFATEYAPELLAGMHATGALRSDKCYWNPFAGESRTAISVLIDLTVSMEQRRGDLPSTPMQMSIDVARKLRDEAKRRALDLELWGIFDGGRQPVSLLRIDESDVERVHALGIGGARMGAGIRFLCRKRSHAGQKHLIICLTDGAGLYVNEGNDDAFGKIRKSHCAHCQLRLPGRRGCSVEKNQRVNIDKSGYIYRSAEFQYADVGHAVDTAPPNTSVRYVEFTQDPYDTLLNRFLRESWRTCIGHFLLEK